MTAVFEINQQLDSKQLSKVATSVGRDGVLLTGYRFTVIDIENVRTTGYTKIEFKVQDLAEARAIRDEISKELQMKVDVYIYNQKTQLSEQMEL